MPRHQPTANRAPEPVLFPHVVEPSGPECRLPLPLTTFVGREQEAQVVGSLLDRSDVRLVTLTGPGGVGKTRLAIRVAENWLSAFTDGIAFIPLDDVRDSDRVPAVVAETLGVFDRTARDPVHAVQHYLADRAFLLVLDNFEHLLAAAPFLTDLLSHCRWLTILVTSRFRLRVSGEHEVVVRPLPVPEFDPLLSTESLLAAPAVELFIHRAQATRADFALSTANAEAVAAICAHLEGLPLAIELAAARMSHMGPGDLLDRLSRGAPVLTDGPIDQPTRLRSLDHAIAWSFDLLSNEERTLLQRLSVFAGGFSLDAAEAIAPPATDTLEGIASLVNKSLLTPLEIDGCSRYDMLESIREFAAAGLDTAGETADVRRRHAAYFVELAEREDEAIWGGPLHRQALDRLEIDLANCRAALGWLEASGDGASLLRLAAALGGSWHYRSHWLEGRTWLAKGLLLGGDSVPAARATALVKRAILTRDLGETPDLAWVDEAVEIRRVLQDDRGIGRALLLASSLIPSDEIERKRVVLAESEAFSTRAENASGLGWVSFQRAVLARLSGDMEDASDQLVDAIAKFRRGQFPFGITLALIELAEIETHRGHNARAAEIYSEALRLWDETRSKELLVNAISRVAEFACSCGYLERAVTLLSALDALGQSARLAAAPSDLARAARIREIASTQLNGAKFADAWEQGSRSTVDRLIASAMELLKSISAAPAPGPAHAPGGLTAREVDVIRLLSAGMSNREIANALSISESTAVSHVRSIFTKLDLSSRTAAAAWAIRHGIDQSA